MTMRSTPATLAGTAFISKPYDRIKLAAILRKILDESAIIRKVG